MKAAAGKVIGDSPQVLIQLKMTARCLFGAPDPASNENLVKKVQETKRWAFERKWNFSVLNEAQSQLAPNSATENLYHWEGSFDSDYMAKCDASRYKISDVPTRVTLLSAPIIFEELPEIIEDSSESPLMDANATESSTSLPVPIEFQSQRPSLGKTLGKSPPTSSHFRSRRSSPIYERDTSRSPPGDYLIFPNLKQRCITDYMKIKKIPPRMKKIRCRE